MTDRIMGVKEVLYILLKTLATCIRGPRRIPEIIHHTCAFGISSLPILAVSTAFAGYVVTGEIAFHMNIALHTVDMIPGFSGQFVFRELGVAIPVCFLVAKVGASITAEVATMKITEQIDALRLLQIDPIEYLVYPRFIASILAVTCLVMIAVFITLSSAAFIAIVKYNFSLLEYLNSMTHFISTQDLIWCVIKGATYGAVIPIISCFYGLNCSAGAEGVGQATTNSVVTSTIIVIVLDFVLSYIFSQLGQV